MQSPSAIPRADSGLRSVLLQLAHRPRSSSQLSDRNVVTRGNRRLAARTTRTRNDQIERRARVSRRRQFENLGCLSAPVALHHHRYAVDHDVQEAADGRRDPGETGPAQAIRGSAVESWHCRTRVRQWLPPTTRPSWKIGRYMAMIRPPISTPSTDMIIGSISAVRLSTALSTCSS